mmetsp:Transcript_5985/g.24274  ORF Transcript_5985/g.24274 Transcript_5985/m.24274 type:complete len:344 (+) Transcript_5985:1562-2593(+)
MCGHRPTATVESGSINDRGGVTPPSSARWNGASGGGSRSSRSRNSGGGGGGGWPCCARCITAISYCARSNARSTQAAYLGGSSTGRLYALTVGWSFTDQTWTYPAVSPNANASPEDAAARDVSLCPIRSRGACEKNPAPALPGPPRSASCVCTSPLSPPSTTVPLNLGWNASATAPAGNCNTLSTRHPTLTSTTLTKGSTETTPCRSAVSPQVITRSPFAATAVTPAACAGEDNWVSARSLFLGSRITSSPPNPPHATRPLAAPVAMHDVPCEQVPGMSSAVSDTRPTPMSIWSISAEERPTYARPLPPSWCTSTAPHVSGFAIGSMPWRSPTVQRFTHPPLV